MIAKDINFYAKIERTDTGKVMRFNSQSAIEDALAEGNLEARYSSLSELKSCGWELLPLTFETLTVGDRVKGKDGTEYVITSASGYGGWRTYVMAYKNDIWKSRYYISYTSNELKIDGFTILPWEEETQKEMTIAEIEQKLSMPSGTLRVKKE